MMLRYSLLSIVLWPSTVMAYGEGSEVKVLQMNTWQEGTMVEGGFEATADEMARLEPDIVIFSEVRSYHGKQFISRILQALEERRKRYYGENSKLDVGILSRYKIEEQASSCSLEDDAGPALKARIRINGRDVVIYSVHLGYIHYACYLPRGYSGVTWKKLDASVLDVAVIEKVNNESLRDEAIRHVIEDARKEKGNIVLLGGDFNKPSHLDWDENTKKSQDHNGTVARWDCSVLLENAGFKDAYRTKYPSPITYPGFTFPPDNEGIAVEKLSWAPDADERDRIGFIYFRPDKKLKLKDIPVVGPSKSIVHSKRIEGRSGDLFTTPLGVWPTDHEAVMATFLLKQLGGYRGYCQ